MSACTHAPPPRIAGAPAAPPSPSEPWRAPRGVVPPEPPAPQQVAIPPEVAARAGALTLSDVVDVALRNNPQTQLSWAQARSGAAAYGAASASYFPIVDASANASRTGSTASSTLGGSGVRSAITPQVTLSYLLFDFGGRSGTVAAAREAAVALDLTHNATLQNVALQAQGAYFTYQAQRALLAAARLTVAEADTNLASARTRNRAGVATIADVLQAETVLAQAQLDLETAEGNLQTARGALGAAMGLPANARYELAATSDSLNVTAVAASVDSLISLALASRPDLAAARAQVLESQAQVRVARAAELPALTLGSNLSKTYSNRSTLNGVNYALSLGVSIPVFNLARPYNVQAAEANADVSEARANLLRTDIAQQVFTSYYALQTATQRVRTTGVLIASATASETAARARYRAGVGTIVDLITAQTALASARAQEAQARWVWANSLAQLAHDVGVIGPRGASAAPLGVDSTGVRR